MSLWFYVGRWGFRLYWFGLKVGSRETVKWVEDYLRRPRP